MTVVAEAAEAFDFSAKTTRSARSATESPTLISRSILGGLIVILLVCGCDRGPVQNSKDVAAKANPTINDTQRRPDAPPDPVETKESTPPESNRDADFQRSEELVAAGDFPGAAAVLKRVLLRNPDDTEALFRYATCAAANGDLSTAVDTLESIPAEHPEAGLPALGQSADWCMELERFADAEQKYNQLLQQAPHLSRAHRQLAFLLNRQGRRHEATEHIKQLCIRGDIRQDELHSLTSVSDAIYDDPNDASQDQPTANSRHYWPIGRTGKARKLFAVFDYTAAAELLREELSKGAVPPTINAFYGRALVESQDDDEFVKWLAKTDEPTKQCAEYWAAVGAYLTQNQRFEEATRALGEALRRDPTDSRSLRRIHQAFTAVGKEEAAKKCFDYYVIMREVTLTSNKISASDPPDLKLFSEIVGGMLALKRPLEAVLWETFEAFYAKRDQDTVSNIAQRRIALSKSDDRFPVDLPALFGVDLQQFPRPNLEQIASNPLSQKVTAKQPAAEPHFENIADRIGLKHTYQVASQVQGSQYAIYQSVGGGVGVIDFDRDGFSDLYFSQGSGDPPDYLGSQSNVLYRSVDGRLSDVTDDSGTIERHYSTGLTVGDWNQDGFPDLVIANLGANRLLTNNGDGTFTSTTTDELDDPQKMTTSLAMGDVTGDAIPDLIELNYADDPTLAKKPERAADGTVTMVGPHEYKPALDRLLVNDGKSNALPQFLGTDIPGEVDQAKSTGLGVVVADFDNQPGNEIFIGNDLYADYFYRLDESGVLRDQAALSGCGFAANGARTATMGIAAADFDNSGALDLHLTNFEQESATLFLNRGTTFQDRAPQFNLANDSLPMVGFGSQAIDYDNNGWSDLVVANGHVENTGIAGQPFKQPHQLFVNRGDRFELIRVIDSSGYADQKHVGRAIAKLDFNRDGKQDYVITHIEERSALMVNQTPSGHHWLRVGLTGTTSERDAIGARVQIKTVDGQKLTQWITGGDGYLCRNEAGVHFGLGNAARIASLIVIWPNGNSQSFSDVKVDQTVLIVEGDQEIFVESAVSRTDD